MKQSLSLKLGQQLTMTPQLQQAIRLLQLSALDLQQEIQDALDSNPMLEVDEEEQDRSDQDNGAASDADADTADLQLNEQESMPDELPVDTSWDDVYDATPAASPATPSSGDFDGSGDFEMQASETESLQDYLHWQLNLTPMTDRDRAIATAIIDAVNPDGMLTAPIEDLMASVPSDVADDPVESDEVVAVLHRLQQFDPIGIAARDLQECLIIQLKALPATTVWRDEAIDVVATHLDLLGSKDFATLKRKTKFSEAELAEIIALIQTLNPRPGSAVESEAVEYIVPDVMVRKIKGQWVVELNGDALPKVRINDLYANFIKKARNAKDSNFMKDNLQEAKWFLKSLQSRNDTLLKVATKIVEHQRGFLEYGEEAMKPLVLHDIADAVEMHESTISRVTNRKYMHTPRGIFELKYFFSSHVSTNTGGEVSSTAIRALIKKLTAQENPRKPLSDSKIASLLGEQNIKVARRTVAKYRESMMIPPSNERKRLI